MVLITKASHAKKQVIETLKSTGLMCDDVEVYEGAIDFEGLKVVVEEP